jgi:uncharacterized protein (TIGR02099 family)
MRKKILRAAGHATRWTTYAGVALLLIGVIAYVGGRYWLPTLVGDKARIEQALSRLSKQQVTIEDLAPHWDGAFPGIAANGIRVYAPGQTQPSIVLKQVRVTMALVPLLQGRIGIHRLVAVEPNIALERLVDNRYRVSGFSTLAAPAQASNSQFVEWLFAQKELTIEGGNIQWLDHLAPQKMPVHLLNVNLSLVNFRDRHRLSFNADFPAELCIHCSVEFDIEGNPLEGDDWGGRVNIAAVGLDLAGLPYAAKSQLPPDLRGRFDLQLRTQWVQGKPRVAQGAIDAFGVMLPPLVSRSAVPIDRLRGNVRWQGRAGSWRMDLDNVLLGLGSTPWSAGHLRLDHNPESTHARIRRVELEQLVAFSRHLELPENINAYVEGLKPSGAINDLVLKWDRRPESPSKFFLKARLSRVAIQKFNRIPGINGLSGHLALDEHSGNFHLNTRKAEMNLPTVFRKTVSVRSLLGQLHWERKEDRWEITAQDIRLAGDAAARGNMFLRVPHDKSLSPYLRLRFDFTRAEGRFATKYLPINRMKPTLVSYLDKSIVSGYGVGGHVVFDGETRSYPFRQGEGTFEALAEIRDAEFNYLDGWTPITSGEVTLLFRGPEMLVTAHSGWVDKLSVKDLVVYKSDLKDRSIPIRVSGRLIGPAESALSVLRGSPLAKRSESWRRFLAPGLEATGPSALNLEIALPRVRGEAPEISGEFRFRGSDVRIPVADFRFNDVTGRIGFTQAGITAGQLQARFLGEPAAVQVAGSRSGGIARTTFTARGKMTATGLASHFGAGVGKFLSGSANYTGELVLQRGSAALRVDSDLAGFKTVLPPPYQSLALPVPEPVIETVVSTKTSHRLRLALGKEARGVLDFGSTNEQWGFRGGHIALGSAPIELPDHSGLHVSLHGARLSGDPWMDLVSGGEGESSLPDFLQQISADIGDLSVFGRQIGRFNVDVRRRDGKWSGTTDGDSASGAVSLKVDGRNSEIELNLARLRIPKKTRETSKKLVDPRLLPTVAIKSKVFEIGDTNYGALDFLAAHTDIGWRILQVSIERPEMSLFANGNWYNIIGHDSVELNLQLDSKNLGGLLAVMGAENMMDRGKLAMTVGLRWREDASRPGLNNLDGTIELSLRDGSLLNVKQGAARLAGALNLSSLTKYASLDFEPVAGGGFAFSTISGRVAIKNGEAYSDGIKVDGSSADIVARGRVGLAREDLDLAADIYPNLRGGITVATGWLWGPATAAWILAAQELLKKEIAEGTRISYTVTGKWSSPKIERVVRKATTNEEEGE